jgi:hypothetical protein
MKYFTDTDFITSPIALLLIFLFAYFHAKRKKEQNTVYVYYVRGLAFKIVAAIGFCLIYALYYQGGDTISYFNGAVALSKLRSVNFEHYFDLITGSPNLKRWMYFTAETGFPPKYMWRDPNTFFVSKVVSIIMIFSAQSFLTTTIILAALSYLGVWKLYLFFTDQYPLIYKRLAIALLFIPSVAFWGSGIMKDTFTYAGSVWFIYNIYKIFFKKEKILLNVVLALINASLVIVIKPYIFIALVPGTLIWIFFQRLKSIKNSALRTLSIPIILIVVFVLISVVFSSLSGYMGDFGSYDKIIEKAQITQEDLIREEQYGKNYYNIGEIEGSFTGILSLTPLALLAGLFRPFIWETASPVMALSGLENAFFLLFTIYLLIRTRIVGFFRITFSEPLIMFSFLYTMFFLFSVGLATANFGALVRYKIPALPFFAAFLLLLLHKYKEEKKAVDQPQ